MSAESPRHARSGGGGGVLTVASQPPSDRTLIDTVSGFLNDVTLAGTPPPDHRDTIQWARFETADVNEPQPDSDGDNELSPLLLVLGYGSGVQVWLIPPGGEAQEVMSWRQGTVRALRVLPTPTTAPDMFAVKRPLLALCDSAAPGPPFCSLSFISVRAGDQVKSIKFKNPILDVLANKRSVVVSFSERFAVFDACTLEDRLSVTTCYPCPCPLGGANPVNPLSLGDRWLAYADKKLNSAKRSSGGCEGEGTSSYTATVLHAAKSLSKGLRGLGESVASSLAGTRPLSQSPSPPTADHHQPGIVTILDIEGWGEGEECGEGCEESVVAHFVAHSDVIIALKFDASGMLLVTADKRGHDFHVFRIHPHPCGPSLAAVHHLYTLHRGDTTAKVQDIALSVCSRWCAVSTLRGTTHVFPITPYGGACGVRTHTQPRVVNRLSRFHRSAGLPIHPARSTSPVGDGMVQGAWFPNPRLPPYPLPTTVQPLAQLRPSPAAAGLPTHTITRNSSGRQRLSSLSEETGGVPLLACARWGSTPPPAPSSAGPSQPHALYVMAATGHLLHYLIHPRPTAGVAKEKVCEDTGVEVDVELVAQWPLSRPPSQADNPPQHLHPANPLLQRPHHKKVCDVGAGAGDTGEEERWLAQVEIVTHAGPHRRLWMGPQFVFKTYNNTLSGSRSSLLEAEAVEVEAGAGAGVARSPPVNMPPGARPLVPVLIDSGSASSLEHSPSDSFRRKSFLEGGLAGGAGGGGRGPAGGSCDVQLREDLAEAMKDTDQGGGPESGGIRRDVVTRAVDPLGTVVASPRQLSPPSSTDDPDMHTHANTDEALFRPVVRAPTALPPRPEPLARPLPAHTSIPVLSLDPALNSTVTPDETPQPLHTGVVIPAALSTSPPLPPSALSTSPPLPPAALSISPPLPPPALSSYPPLPPAALSNSSPLPSLILPTSPPLPPPALSTSPPLPTPVFSTFPPLPPPEHVPCDNQPQQIVIQEENKPTKKKGKRSRRSTPTETETELTRPDLESIERDVDIANIDITEYIAMPVEQARMEEAFAEFTIRVPDTKRVEEHNGSIELKQDNRTEEEMWAMLSGQCSHIESDEVKPKPRKTKKNKTKVSTKQEDVEIVTREIVETEFEKDLGNDHDIVHYEVMKKLDENEQQQLHEKTMEFVKARSCSPETKRKSSKRNKDIDKRVKETKDIHIDTVSTPDLHQPRNQPEPTEKNSVDNLLKNFDLPLDFDTYFLKKMNSHKDREENLNIDIKSVQNPFIDVVTTQPTRSKRSTKKDAMKYEDFISIDKFKPANMQEPEPELFSLSEQIDEPILMEIKESELFEVGPSIEDFPTIGNSRGMRSNKKRNNQPVLPKQPVLISYSAIASKAAPAPEIIECASDLSVPSRSSLRDKLAEICKRTDIALAECDAPLDLPVLEPLEEFSFEQFQLDVMRDIEQRPSEINIDEHSKVCEFNVDDVLKEGSGSGEEVSSQTDSDPPPPLPPAPAPAAVTSKKKSNKKKRK